VILRGRGMKHSPRGSNPQALPGPPSHLARAPHLGDAVTAMRECPAPVIARLTGHCHGAGVELALTCDLRVGTPSVRMSVPAVGLGVVYRYEFVARLVLMVGLSRAESLLLGMRELDAETANAWGIFTERCEAAELDARVNGLAGKLATSPRTAVRGTKASLNLLRDRPGYRESFRNAQRLPPAAAPR